MVQREGDLDYGQVLKQAPALPHPRRPPAAPTAPNQIREMNYLDAQAKQRVSGRMDLRQVIVGMCSFLDTASKLKVPWKTETQLREVLCKTDAHFMKWGCPRGAHAARFLMVSTSFPRNQKGLRSDPYGQYTASFLPTLPDQDNYET